VTGQQHLELPDRSGRGVDRQQPFDPALLRLEAQVVEPCRLGQQQGLVGQSSKGWPAPQRQRILQQADGDGRVHREGLPCVPQERVEASGVQLGGVEPQAVAGRAPLDAVVTEGFAEMPDVGLDDVPSLLGRVLTPDRVDQGVGKHELVRPDNQMGKDRALLRSTQGDGAMGPVHFERPEDLKVHRLLAQTRLRLHGHRPPSSSQRCRCS
jgi:hypothetical protein